MKTPAAGHFGRYTPPAADPKTASLAGIEFNDTTATACRTRAKRLATAKVIFLDTNNSGVLDSGEKSVSTGANGAWSSTA